LESVYVQKEQHRIGHGQTDLMEKPQRITEHITAIGHSKDIHQ